MTATKTQAKKRIDSIVVRRIEDEDGDTSWLGEYSNKRASEFSIDRAHALDCRAVTTPQSVFDDLETTEECGSCGSYHPSNFAGDCRDDENRFPSYEREECCNCQAPAHFDRHTYRYFNPSRNYVDANGAALPENTPAEVREYVRQDYERMEALNRGEWCFVGVQAVATVAVSLDGRSWKRDKITSGGLWGIESDSDESYFLEVEAEQLSELKDLLRAYGFGRTAIAKAVKAAERESE